MRRASVLVGALATVSLAYVCPSQPAHASNYGIELNGTYRVTANGDWSKTNDVFIDERTVIQTWTISSSCVSPIECSGEVESDQGWTAPLRYSNSRWIIDREVPNWEPCPDGTAATGSQTFLFWGVSQNGMGDAKNIGLLAGWDRTAGPSGACGINKPLVIKTPIRVERVT
jgi:hypothetical protein